FVAQLACLVCGRAPSHAHHIRYAQTRALGLKVSDEFTVPLCSVHHDEIHRTGDERSWWVRRQIDPLKAAAELWASTQGRGEPATPIVQTPLSAADHAAENRASKLDEGQRATE